MHNLNARSPSDETSLFSSQMMDLDVYSGTSVPTNAGMMNPPVAQNSEPVVPTFVHDAEGIHLTGGGAEESNRARAAKERKLAILKANRL